MTQPQLETIRGGHFGSPFRGHRVCDGVLTVLDIGEIRLMSLC